VLLAASLSLFVAAPPAASASGWHEDPELVVMTRNLYLGASLTPALVATDPASFLGAVAQIYGTARFTNFPARAEALADEVAANRPDLLGLQEVTRWETSGPGVPPTQDFLTILTAELAERGLDYTVAGVSDNANIGPVPLVTPCESTVVGACLVTLKDRDVILVNDDRRGLWWGHARSGTYTAQQTFTPPVPGAEPVSFRRGWVTIDGWLKGHPFHFANTHLETEDFPAVQEAQAAEFLAGPALGRGADIAVGDFNSAADGSTTDSYEQLTRVFTDAWRVNRYQPGFTCCQNETLTNPQSQLSSRIDLVLSRYPAKPRSAHVVGAVPFQAVPPLWPSDHAGVVATLKLDY
jgi:endonuclease/exonuclease/phosphatase family metal-dependent hydrolase